MNLADFVDRLGPGFRLLPRLHYLVTARGVPINEPGVLDVSYHPDVAELYLAADVLVTDYSSVMFDFAVTGKPIIFYAYDLAAFRDNLRGFYLDLEPIALGPVVATPEELAGALHDLSGVRQAYGERYRVFRQTYCALEDGRASARLGGFVARLCQPRAGEPVGSG